MTQADDSTAYFTINDRADLSAAVVRTPRLPLLKEGSEVDRSMIATIVSELGSNIIKYANRGVLRLCRTQHQDEVDIDIWAEDHGPGIADVALAMQDHFSTGNSLGLGLPGVRRMADQFWIRSSESAGTLVFARKRLCGKPLRELAMTSRPSALVAMPPSGAKPDPRWDASGWVRPTDGHTACGDASVVQACDGGVLLAIVDASGHGARAHGIAQCAVATIKAFGGPDLDRLMARIHQELQGTVGAAVGLAFVDADAASFRYLGVGNTRAAKFGGKGWYGVSRDGVLGDRMPSLLEQRSPLSAGDLLVMWTDGIPEYACSKLAAATSYRDAGDIASRLINELAKPYDDAGCLVFKWQA
jgi:anti-sigma regulatory factor (Ser/Thr protein kinase)